MHIFRALLDRPGDLAPRATEIRSAFVVLSGLALTGQVTAVTIRQELTREAQVGAQRQFSRACMQGIGAAS